MIEPARLSWRDGQPYAEAFRDIYHAPDGAGEVQRVFLQPANFQALLRSGRPLLVGELGFGTGLNFAVAAEQCVANKVHLHFVSFEAAPIDPRTFLDLSSDRKAEHPIYERIGEDYPPLIHGWHRRRFHHGLITLSVFWGEACAGLSQLASQQQRPFDLWLLDGFAPDRNPAMWSEDLFHRLASVSTPGTAVTTFTSAGRVRRSLQALGFEMRRVDQRPYKRESLAGTFRGVGLEKTDPPKEIHIAGAGIAAASVARELAESGTSVRVFEASAQIAAGASGVPITVMHPRLQADGSASADFRVTAYAHALAACRSYLPANSAQPGRGIVASGALQIASPNYPLDRLTAVEQRYGASGLHVELLSARAASELSGIPIDGPALWFRDACVVNTPAFCATLFDHPNIEVQTERPLSAWPDHPTILACGVGTQAFPDAEFLELAAVSGQLDLISATGKRLESLKLPIVGNGYIAPLPGAEQRLDRSFGVGATYEYNPWPATEATERNLRNLERIAPDAYRSLSVHKATRSVSSDRNPIIGSLYSLDQRKLVDKFVTTGHGSMGTVTSHLGAAMLAARLHRDFIPLAPALDALVSPLRFRIRQARRGYRSGATA